MAGAQTAASILIFMHSGERKPKTRRRRRRRRGGGYECRLKCRLKDRQGGGGGGGKRASHEREEEEQEGDKLQNIPRAQKINKQINK